MPEPSETSIDPGSTAPHAQRHLKNEKAAQVLRGFFASSGGRLLDLAFLVFDMLARDGVVLSNHHLFRHRSGILLGHVEMPRVSGRIQTDLDRRRLRHGPNSSAGSIE